MMGVFLRCLWQETPVEQRKDWVFPVINTARIAQETPAITHHVFAQVFLEQRPLCKDRYEILNIIYVASKHGTNDIIFLAR